MLCPDVLPEDAFLREDLKTARLNRLLSIIESERSQSNFTRPCLFCRKFYVHRKKEKLNLVLVICG